MKSNTKRRAMLLLFMAVCAACIALFAGACQDKEPPETEYTLLVYTASEGGSIDGKSVQVCTGDAQPETVTAVPDEGYVFVGWSDGYIGEIRLDDGEKPIEATALFERREVTLHFHYNLATGGADLFSMEMDRYAPYLPAPVPTREHFEFCGWYADEEMTRQITDENGVFVDVDIFDGAVRDLYARWRPIEADIMHYDVLLVFVTEIKAEDVTVRGSTTDIDFSMTQEQRTACEELAATFEETINDLYDGLVVINVDTYFTRQTVGVDELNISSYYCSVYADDLPELQESGLLPQYRNVITCASFGDVPGGNSDVVLDEFFKYPDSPYTLDDVPEEFIFAFSGNCSVSFRGYGMEWVCEKFGAESRPQVMKMYLLGCLPYDLPDGFTDRQLYEAMSESFSRMGIPYGYWKNEFYEVTVVNRTTKWNEGSNGLLSGAIFDDEKYFHWVDEDISVTNNGDGTYTTTYTTIYRLCAGMEVTLSVAGQPGIFHGWDDGYKGTERTVHVDGDLSFGVTFTDPGIVP